MRKKGIPENVDQIMASMRVSVSRVSDEYRTFLRKKGVLDKTDRLAMYLQSKKPEYLKGMLESIQAERKF